MNRPLPTGIAVLGALNLFFGGLAALNSLYWLARRMGNGDGLSFLIPSSWPEDLLWIIVRVLGLLLGPLLIAAGVGLLRLRYWGRTLSLCYAGLTIGLTVTVLVESLRLNPIGGSLPPGITVAWLVSHLGGVAYPLLLLALLNLSGWRKVLSRRYFPAAPAETGSAASAAFAARSQIAAMSRFSGWACLVIGALAGLGHTAARWLFWLEVVGQTGAGAQLWHTTFIGYAANAAALPVAAGIALLTGARWGRAVGLLAAGAHLALFALACILHGGFWVYATPHLLAGVLLLTVLLLPSTRAALKL